MSLLKEKLELKAEEAKFKIQKSLSGFEKWQKWTIISILLLIIPGYFISKTISNVYYEKQFEKFLITAKPSYSDPQKLLIERIDLSMLGENEYAVTAQIYNPNLELSAKNIPYEFRFFASDGSAASLNHTGAFFILPGQKKILILPKINSFTNIAKVDLVLSTEIKWQNRNNLPELKIITTQPKGHDAISPFGYTLEGSVLNNSAFQIKEVKLLFLLYGPGGKIVGASQRSEFDVKPQEKRDYKQLWPGISGRNVVRAEAISEINILDQSNLISPQINTSGNAGNLDR